MKMYQKRDFPVEKVRRFLEPGPIVLVSSQWKGERNVMTMGWQTCMEFSPALVGCLISEGSHSFEMIRRSKECVINVPEVHLAETVVGIGNCSGEEVDKFEEFGLTAVEGAKVKAPMIGECYANLECRLVDGRMIKRYNFFIFEVVKAHAPLRPRYPRTMHYRGEGQFMVAGKEMSLRGEFKKENL